MSINKKEIEAKVESLKKELNDLEILLKEPEKSKEELIEELFLSLIQNSKYKIIGESNFWYNSNNECIIHQDKKTKHIWFSYKRFLSHFDKKFNYNFNEKEITVFLSKMVVKHLDLTDYISAYFGD